MRGKEKQIKEGSQKKWENSKATHYLIFVRIWEEKMDFDEIRVNLSQVWLESSDSNPIYSAQL